jgi:ABC-type bacteriocin/lantibiotic exporter with double-glycine peptidase domain
VSIIKAIRQRVEDALDVVSEGVQRAEENVRSSSGDRYLAKFPRKLQADTFSCGAQCALAVLEYYGVELTIDTVLRRLGTDNEGTTDSALRRLFRGYGLGVRSVTDGTRSHLERAIGDGSPVIVSVDRRSPHWAVVYGIGRGRVYIADPSVKRTVSIIQSWTAFRRRWDGDALIVEPTARSRERRRRHVVEVE